MELDNVVDLLVEIGKPLSVFFTLTVDIRPEPVCEFVFVHGELSLLIPDSKREWL